MCSLSGAEQSGCLLGSFLTVVRCLWPAPRGLGFPDLQRALHCIVSPNYSFKLRCCTLGPGACLMHAFVQELQRFKIVRSINNFSCQLQDVFVKFDISSQAGIASDAALQFPADCSESLCPAGPSISPFFCSEPPLRSGSTPAPTSCPGLALRKVPLVPRPAPNAKDCPPASSVASMVDLHKEVNIGGLPAPVCLALTGSFATPVCQRLPSSCCSTPVKQCTPSAGPSPPAGCPARGRI